MRQRKNGFTRFMKKLDRRNPKLNGVDTSEFEMPMDYNIPSIIRLLIDLEITGDASRLGACFLWDSTPQGLHYWADIAEGITEIDGKGLAYLYWLLENE